MNENPTVQIIVLGVVGVVFAFLLFKTVLKKDEPPASDPTDPAAAVADPAAAADPAVAPAPVDPAVDPAAAAPVAPVAPATPAPVPSVGEDLGAADGLLPTKGLPEDVLVAYAKDKAIALLVVDPNGFSDNQVKDYTKALRAADNVAVFIVKSRSIGRYSRITSGVLVNRTPALVIVRPRKLNEAAPTATVAYGFRSPTSVRQALDDALFDGREVTAYP